MVGSKEKLTSRGKLSRDSQSQERRAVILQAALKVIAKKGFYGVTVGDIAKEANMSPGTLYLYFENKEALLNALGQEALPTSLQASGLKGETLGTSQETLERLASTYLENKVKQGRDDLIRLFILRGLRSTKRLRALYEEMIDQMFTGFEEHLRTGIEEGTYREIDARIATRSFVGMFLPFVIMADVERRLRLKDPIVHDQDQIVKAVVDIYLHGIVANDDKPEKESEEKPI
jgi:TetR/AcrR family transcriptional regulator, fatty acid metabolism regulator protein